MFVPVIIIVSRALFASGDPQAKFPFWERDYFIRIQIAVSVYVLGAGFWSDYFLDAFLENAELLPGQELVPVGVQLVKLPLRDGLSETRISIHQTECPSYESKRFCLWA